MTGRDPTPPSLPVEADVAATSDDVPSRHDDGWTDTQRIVVGVIVAAIAVIVLVLVVFVFSGPDEASTPAPTVPITAAPALAPTTPTSVTIAPPPST